MRHMKLIGLSLLLVAGSASAQVTGTVTATTDYDFRGITQTARDPAIQGSIDWALDSGFYVRAWGSNVDFGNCCGENVEVRYYAGFAGGDEDGLGFDAGIVYYSYPAAADIDFPEAYAGISYQMFDGKFWYSNDFLGSDASAWYLEANANIPLPQDFGLMLHLGYSDGNYWEPNFSYFDYAVGVTKSWAHFDFALKWIDGSDLAVLENTPNDVLTSESKIVFSVSTTFPWSIAEGSR